MCITFQMPLVYHKLRKTFGNFLRHTLNFCPNLVQYRFNYMIHLVFYGDLVYKLRTVKGEANFILSGSKIVKRLQRRQYDPAIIERTICLMLGHFTALYRSFLQRSTLTKRLGLYTQTKVKQHHIFSETLFWKLQNGICG